MRQTSASSSRPGRLNGTTPFTKSNGQPVVAACACFYKKLGTSRCKPKKTLRVTFLITRQRFRQLRRFDESGPEREKWRGCSSPERWKHDIASNAIVIFQSYRNVCFYERGNIEVSVVSGNLKHSNLNGGFSCREDNKSLKEDENLNGRGAVLSRFRKSKGRKIETPRHEKVKSSRRSRKSWQAVR